MPPPLLQLERVTRVFAATPPVVAVDDVSLTVDRGEFVSVVGRSGSGKSTLLNLLALLDSPSAGAYRIDGADVTGLPERARARMRARTFGFVFQQFHLLDRETVTTNVALGLRYRREAPHLGAPAVAAAIDRVGLGHRAHQRAATLSGGERQRAAVARAIVGAAPVLVADEPTGNLDRATAASVIDLLLGLHREGTTLVLVTHDHPQARRAGRCLELVDGRLQDQGPPGAP